MADEWGVALLNTLFIRSGDKRMDRYKPEMRQGGLPLHPVTPPLSRQTSQCRQSRWQAAPHPENETLTLPYGQEADLADAEFPRVQVPIAQVFTAHLAAITTIIRRKPTANLSF